MSTTECKHHTVVNEPLVTGMTCKENVYTLFYKHHYN